MKVIAGSSNPKLASNIANSLGAEVINVELSKFSNDETRIIINDPDQSLRGESVVLVQSFSQPVDQRIIEFLLITDSLERLGVKNINFVNPWMGYSFQDKVFRKGEPIAAKVVADLISRSAVKRVYLLDLHNSSIPGFFSIPTHHLSALKLFADFCQQKIDLKKAVVVSPDFGGLKRARVFADHLGLELTEIDKRRDFKTGQVTVENVHGNVDQKIVLIFDDAILSGGTVIEASKILKKKGATKIYFFATHGLFVKEAVTQLENSSVDHIVITNTLLANHIRYHFCLLSLLGSYLWA